MKVDLTELTLAYKDDKIPPEEFFWEDYEKAQEAEPATPNKVNYSREFLVGYLLHYCRLCQKMNRRGTIPMLEALLQVEPDNAEVHYLLGLQHEMEDDLESALNSFERAAALRPDKPTYTLAGVSVACQLGDRNKGLEMVCNVISAYPDMAEAYFERGLIHETDENWTRAMKDYDNCIRLDPENPGYLVASARMYRKLKLFKVARRLATKALKLDPNYSLAHEELRQLPFFEQFVDFFRNEDSNTSKKN